LEKYKRYYRKHTSKCIWLLYILKRKKGKGGTYNSDIGTNKDLIENKKSKLTFKGRR